MGSGAVLLQENTQFKGDKRGQLRTESRSRLWKISRMLDLGSCEVITGDRCAQLFFPSNFYSLKVLELM